MDKYILKHLLIALSIFCVGLLIQATMSNHYTNKWDIIAGVFYISGIFYIPVYGIILSIKDR